VSNLRQGKFPGHTARSVWAVEFYAPWCAHCKQLASVWEALAGQAEGLFRVGAVNCEQEKALCAMYGATSFPLIKLFRGASSLALDGAAERSPEALRRWVLDNLPTSQLAPLSPRRPETLDAWIAGACAAGVAAGAEQGGEGAGACVVAFHREPATPAWLKALSFAQRGRVPMGEAKGHGVEALAASLGVSELPVAVALCGGDRARTLAAPKGLTRAATEEWVASLREACAGVTARERPRLDVGSDYGALKVAQLRTLLASRGVACALCVEKQDFVAAVRLLAAQEAQEARGQGAAAPPQANQEL